MSAYRLGYSALCEIQLPNEKGIEAKHAEIKALPDGRQLIRENELDPAEIYVNGIRIKQKIVTEKDEIRCGAHRFKLNRYFKLRNGSIVSVRHHNDFREEFLELKTLYSNYFENKLKIEKKMYEKILWITPLLLIPMFGGALKILIDSMMNPQIKIKIEQELNSLRSKFSEQYHCPCCERPFGVKPWQDLADQKTCPHCHAKWY